MLNPMTSSQKAHPQSLSGLVSILSIFILILGTLVVPHVSWAQATQIEVVSMNLRWYGSKKFPPHNDDERDEHLPIFFSTHYKDTDVFLFQEITDPLRLQNTIGRGYKCLSTRNRGTSYQYVVTCYNPKTVKPVNVTSDIFDTGRTFDISFGIFGLRNALHIQFQSVKFKTKFLHTINLHLRASPEHSEFRVNQVGLLLDQMIEAGLHKKKGLVIGGDLNSFGRKTTQNKKDDIYLFLDQADQRGFELHTEFAFPTHIASGPNRFFDYLLVPHSNWLNSYQMFVACSQHASTEPDTYENLRYYRTYVSDHCPISIRIPTRDI